MSGQLTANDEAMDFEEASVHKIDNSKLMSESASSNSNSNQDLIALIQQKVIKPGKAIISVDCLGQNFFADLLSNGSIEYEHTKFPTLSSWIDYCKQRVSIDKRAPGLWSKIKYQSKPLEFYKNILNQRKENIPMAGRHQDNIISQGLDLSSSKITHSYGKYENRGSFSHDKSTAEPQQQDVLDLSVSIKSNLFVSNKSIYPQTSIKSPDNKLSSPYSDPSKNSSPMPGIAPPAHSSKPLYPPGGSPFDMSASPSPFSFSPHFNNMKPSSQSIYSSPSDSKKPLQPAHNKAYNHNPLHTSQNMPNIKPGKVSSSSTSRPSGSAKYSAIRVRTHEIDSSTTVETISFSQLKKIQPFNCSISTNCMILMDFHCSLTTSEVVGYLGGKWDAENQTLRISQAFPMKCYLADKENNKGKEDEIKDTMLQEGLILVGWYHSHPRSPANPSLKDIDAQMEYQANLKGPENSYMPCVGIIISPNHNDDEPHLETNVKVYWIMAPPENKPLEYGMPMQMDYERLNDSNITNETFKELKSLRDFYDGAKDNVKFNEKWVKGYTYLDRLKGGLVKRFANEHVDGRFLEYVHNLLSVSC